MVRESSSSVCFSKFCSYVSKSWGSEGRKIWTSFPERLKLREFELYVWCYCPKFSSLVLCSTRLPFIGLVVCIYLLRILDESAVRNTPSIICPHMFNLGWALPERNSMLCWLITDVVLPVFCCSIWELWPLYFLKVFIVVVEKAKEITKGLLN